MKRCLIIDGSKVVRLVARKILEDLEFSVEEAGDTGAALDIIKASVPDVVFFAWDMDGVNGVAFLREMLQVSSDKKPVIIVCAAVNDPAQIKGAIEAGASEYIMKPFDSEIIESKLQQVGLV